MNYQPKITVVTVCYNVVSTLEATMLSVLNQTYPNVEYIVIDGGSTDGTLDIIKKYADRLAYWVSEPDKGIYDAMNKGIKVATGEWINFMNAGDAFFSMSTLAHVAPLLTAEKDYVCGIAKYPNGRYWIPISHYRSFEQVFKGGSVNHQSSFIRTALLKEEPYSLDYPIMADDFFFIRKVALEGHCYASLPLVIALYDNRGVSSDKRHTQKLMQERKLFLQRNLSSLAERSLRNPLAWRVLKLFAKMPKFAYVRFVLEKRSK